MSYNFHNSLGYLWRTFWVLAVLLFCTLAQSVAAVSLELEWDPSPDEVSGYRLWYGTSPGQYSTKLEVGPGTIATIHGLEEERTYYVVVTAYDAEGVESVPSNEISFPAPAKRPAHAELTSPVAGSSFDGPGNVALTAEVSFPDEEVARVEFYQGAVKLGEDDSAPYKITWKDAQPGEYGIRAVAVGASGQSLQSETVRIAVVALKLDDFEIQPDGSCRIVVKGAAGSRQTVWASDDLESWERLSTTVNLTGTTMVVDSSAATKKQRFYRVTSEGPQGEEF